MNTIKLGGNSYYKWKDQRKSDKANKYIGRGVKGSATDNYRISWGNLANCGSYTAEDRIFVSVNGRRPGGLGISLITEELLLAIAAKATFIADSFAWRMKSYNTGERELATFLTQHNYYEAAPGIWKPKAK